MNFKDGMVRQAWRLVLVSLLLGDGIACQAPRTTLDDADVQRYEQAAAEAESLFPMPPLPQIDRPAPVELSGQAAADPSLEAATWLHLPDPSTAPEVLKKRLEITRFGQKNIRREYETIYRETLELIKDIERPNKVRLSLAECIRRALANNYQIKIDGYAPAISTAQIVQAEAAFDTAFFANVSRDNVDRPTPTQLASGDSDTTIVSGGIRKLLSTGALVTFSQQMIRSDAPGFAFNVLNPAWTHNFVAELRQPLLRGFGIDFNRAQINISKNQRKIDREAFRARVIEILVSTEQAYWNLMAARRDVVISAEVLAQARLTFKQVDARKDFDAYRTLLYQSDSNVKGREFQYLDVKNRIGNLEDQLLNVLNDPELPLSSDVEIIPIDGPTVVEVVRDRYKAVETALQHRPEILQARHLVDNARLQLGIAKNQALPQLDVTYRVTVQGLGASSDQAFDEMTGANFINQFVGMELLWSIGERAERAGIRIAALQQSQAVLSYKRALDDIITDCRVALRNLETDFEQFQPSHLGVVSASENLRSIQERQERKSPAELNTVFNAQDGLAQARRALLTSLLNYNTGIVDVERAKGTLIEYDNVALAEQP